MFPLKLECYTSIIMTFLDQQHCITIINGKAQAFEWDHCGLMIKVPSDCLPSYLREGKLLLTAHLNTEITLPPNSSLVSGVYNIKLDPNIEKLNKPIELVIEHCVVLKPGQECHLSFVVAKGILPTKFNYLEGGEFYFDPKTNKKFGKILLSTFSDLAITSPSAESDIDCYGRLYYDDSEFNCRKVQFVITKNIELAYKVRIALGNTSVRLLLYIRHILTACNPYLLVLDVQCLFSSTMCIRDTLCSVKLVSSSFQIIEKRFSSKENDDMNVSFHKPEIRLEIPSEEVGGGWKFYSTISPLEVSN